MRDCNNCIWHDGQCVAWECNFIPRQEAGLLWSNVKKRLQAMLDMEIPVCKELIETIVAREEQKPQSLLEAMAKFRAEEGAER